MAITTNKSLPSGYLPVSYIEAAGTQYINTGVTTRARWELDIQFTEFTTRQLMGYSGNSWEYWGVMANGQYEAEVTAIGNLMSGSRDFVVHDFETNIIKIQSASLAIGKTISPTSQYQIFAIGGGYRCHARLWGCKCIQNGTLIRDFVPCINAAGVVGLYDLVNDTFYTDAAGGTFSAPPAPNSKLPNGITELEYIRTTGTQYINTGYVYKQIPTAEIDYATEEHKNTEIFGWGAKEPYSFLANDDTGGYDNRLDLWDGAYWNTTISNIPNIVRSRNKIMFAKNGTAFDILQNGIWVGSVTNANSFASNTYPARVFSGRETANHKGRLYGAKLWDNGTLVRNLVPCKLANGAIGVYDTVNCKFYGNAGSGSFIAGPVLSALPADYVRLDYIQSTGIQHIDTGIVGNTSDKFTLNMSVAYSITSPANQIMGFGGNTGHGMGSEGKTWWEAGALSEIIQGQHVYTSWSVSPDNTWSRTANGLTVTGSQSHATINGDKLLLFAAPTAHGTNDVAYRCFCKLFAAQILKNDVVVRNYIPCINPNGIAGLYDSIENKFYGNGDATKFTLPTNGSLPTGYTPVEYIQSFGAQWIDMELPARAKTWVNADILFSSAFDYNMMFGEWDNFSLSLHNGNAVAMGVGGTSTQSLGSTTIPGVKYNFVIGPGQGLIQNGVRYAIGGAENEPTQGNLMLFAAADGGTPNRPWSWGGFGRGKVYNFKVYEGVTGSPETSRLMRAFVPCISPSGEAGMYELVQQRFYYNRGSGCFAAGPTKVKVPEGYTKLTAIQSTGSQYINIDYTTSKGMVARYQVNMATNSSCYIVGSHAAAAPYGRNGVGLYSSGAWELGYGEICPHFGTNYAYNTTYHVVASTRFKNAYINVDGTTLGSDTSEQATSTTPVYVFSTHYHLVHGHPGASATLYNLTLSSTEHLLIRNLTPCLNPSGSAGLYDYVTGLFFANSGSGSLVPRSPVTNMLKHKTLLNGVAYDIIGGKALVDGTVREVLNGKTLVSGTAYSIPLKQNVIALSFNNNGGSGGMTGKLYYHYGKNAFYSDPECWNQVTSITAPTRTGYTFDGYCGDGTCGGNNGEHYIGYGSTIFADDLCTDIYKSATLYANWIPNKYTISFDSNGGSACSAITVTYDAAIGTLPTPSRSGYYFMGWYTGTATRDSSIAYKDRPWIYYSDAYGDLYNAFGYNDLNLASHYWDTTGRGSENRRRSEYISADKYTTAGNKTLYAGWTPILTISQSVRNDSDWSGLKDFSWDSYEAYRALTIQGGSDVAASSGSFTVVYGQRAYVMATNKYSERWSNIYINGADQGETLKAEYTAPVGSNWSILWVFDTRNWIFDNPQAFWDCYITT